MTTTHHPDLPGRARRLARTIRYELDFHRTIRLQLLRTELRIRGIASAYRLGDDGIAIAHQGLWFGVYPWFRDDNGQYVWAIGNPNPGHDGDDIAYRHGFRFPPAALPRIWADYLTRTRNSLEAQ
ncbi:hypothetical protein ACWDYH_03880 [Nocardia goodfellowii]